MATGLELAYEALHSQSCLETWTTIQSQKSMGICRVGKPKPVWFCYVWVRCQQDMYKSSPPHLCLHQRSWDAWWPRAPPLIIPNSLIHHFLAIFWYRSIWHMFLILVDIVKRNEFFDQGVFFWNIKIASFHLFLLLSAPSLALPSERREQKGSGV